MSTWEQIGQTFFGIQQHDWADSNLECFLRDSLCALKKRNRKQIIAIWYPALECSSWKLGLWTPRKHVESICLFTCLIGKGSDDTTCCIEIWWIHIEWWEHIYLICYNSHNDWFPWGQCMIFMPLLEFNLKSDSLFIVFDISQNDCFLEEVYLTLKSLAHDWYEG